MKRAPPPGKGYISRTVVVTVPSFMAHQLQNLSQDRINEIVKDILAKNTDAIYPIGERRE